MLTGRPRESTDKCKTHLPARVGDLATSLADWNTQESVQHQKQKPSGVH